MVSTIRVSGWVKGETWNRVSDIEVNVEMGRGVKNRAAAPRKEEAIGLLRRLLLHIFHVARIAAAAAFVFVRRRVHRGVMRAVFHFARITTATARPFVA